jgi:hypothetical protein
VAVLPEFGLVVARRFAARTATEFTLPFVHLLALRIAHRLFGLSWAAPRQIRTVRAFGPAVMATWVDLRWAFLRRRAPPVPSFLESWRSVVLCAWWMSKQSDWDSPSP